MAPDSQPLVTTREGRKHLHGFYLDTLMNDTLPFWLENPHCIDWEHGGFLHSLDRDGTLLDTDKAMWAQGRFSWMLARIFNEVERRDEFLELAKHGVRFIRDHGFDTDGRMFFRVTRDGSALIKRRYAFTEMFAIMAMSELARATNDERLRDEAEALFLRVERYLATPGMLPPKVNPKVRSMRSLGVPMILIVTAQIVREIASKPEDYTTRIDRYIAEIRDDFVRPEFEAVVENVNAENGSLLLDHFDGRILNPGHSLEAGWFILHEAQKRNDSSLIDLGAQIIDWSWQRGWDSECGGLLYYRDILGFPVQEYWQDMKFWWTHNEGVIATLFAYQLTGQDRFARRHQQIHDWSHQHFPDPEFGEWYGYLRRDGRVSAPLKGNMWKSLFHLPRMQLTCWQLLGGAQGPE